MGQRNPSLRPRPAAQAKARRVVGLVYHELTDEQRAKVRDTIERMLCDA
jgi:hypothetical protein